MRVYVASGLDNIENAKRIATKFEAAGHTITYRWMDHGPVSSRGPDGVAAVAASEVGGVVSADVVVVVLPGGRGTHFEMGGAVCLGIPTLLYAADPKQFECNKDVCAFYLHPRVSRTSDEDGIVALAEAMAADREHRRLGDDRMLLERLALECIQALGPDSCEDPIQWAHELLQDLRSAQATL